MKIPECGAIEVTVEKECVRITQTSYSIYTVQIPLAYIDAVLDLVIQEVAKYSPVEEPSE